MHPIFNNADEYISNHWINWCRLCAKEDKELNINFLYQNDDHLINENKKSNIQEALAKYFYVQTFLEDSLPKMLCTSCLSLVSSIINFNERVERVQLMFLHLAEAENSKNCLDLNSVRLKFDATEAERDYWFNKYPLRKMDKKDDELSSHECSKQSVNDNNLKVQIKEENAEKLMAFDYDKYMVQDTIDIDKEELIFDDNGNDAFPEDDEDPFQHYENNVESPSEQYENEKSSQTLSYKSDDMVKPKADRIIKKRKSKKCMQFSNSDCKKKKSIMKDFKVEASCKDCEKSFPKYMLYREHMQQQHDHSRSDKHWPCPACDKVLLSIYNLERHIRIHVPLEVRKTIKCPECDNRYTSNAQLETHVRYKHKNEKPFICEECGLCLRTNSNLRQHMLIHTDIAPFECEVCKKTFKNKTRLKTHMDIHSANKHVCNVCGLQLNSRATLNRHFLVHSDEMQHKCDYCGKAFKRAKALKNHLLLHTGLKPYSCDFCERTFANGSNCRSHMKKMHPEELAVLEASGNKTHTKNIPKLETLKAVTKAADNLTPVVTKFSGCFAFGKKPKRLDSTGITQLQKAQQKLEHTTISSPSTTPLDLQYFPLVGNTTTSPASLPNTNNIDNNLSTSTTTATTPIPNFNNIYQHLLKHNQADLQIKQPLSHISPQSTSSNVSPPHHNPFYNAIVNNSIKPSRLPSNNFMNSPEHSHRSPMTPLTHEDLSNPSSIQGSFYGSIGTALPPSSFIVNLNRRDIYEN